MKHLNHLKRIFKNGGKKVLKNGSYSIGLTFIVIAVIVIINLIVSEIPSQYIQFDFSEQKLYTVSDDTKEFLSTLDEDITIYFIAQDKNEDTIMKRLLELYDDYSDHVKVEQKDPVVNPNFASQYTDGEVTDNSVIVVSGERSKVIDYNQLYETEVDYTTYSTNTTGFDGEGQITSAIEYVISDDIPVMYTLEGHGEAELSESVTSAIAKENIELKSLNLVTEGQVPEDASALLICSPSSDFSQEETDTIIKYLENGGNALIFTDYLEEKLENVQSILENYGVRTMDGIILEGDTSHYAFQMPYYLVPNIKDSDITSELTEKGLYILMPAAQGIETLEQKRDTVTLTPLLSTSEDSFTKTDVQNMENYEKEEGDVAGPFDIGMYITENVDNDNTTKVVYFSSSSILNDQVDQMISGGDMKLVTNVISTLCKDGEDASSISIPSKSLQTDYLTLTAYDVSFWMIVTIVLIPGLCLVFGLAVWLKRRKL